MMKKWTVYISETYSGYVEIEADSKDEAHEIAVGMLDSGDINPRGDFGGGTFVEVNDKENEL
jgi:hypothetical protein